MAPGEENINQAMKTAIADKTNVAHIHGITRTGLP
jgi:hypothetical protein